MLAEAHAALGMEKSHYEFDFPGAEKEFLLAMKMDPSDPLPHTGLGALRETLKFAEYAVMLAAASSTDTIRAGEKCATKPSSSTCSRSAVRCRASGGASWLI